MGSQRDTYLANALSYCHPVYNDAAVVKAHVSLDAWRPTSSPQRFFSLPEAFVAALFQILPYLESSNKIVFFFFLCSLLVRFSVLLSSPD